jgi:hypothetical protein
MADPLHFTGWSLSRGERKSFSCPTASGHLFTENAQLCGSGALLCYPAIYGLVAV